MIHIFNTPESFCFCSCHIHHDSLQISNPALFSLEILLKLGPGVYIFYFIAFNVNHLSVVALLYYIAFVLIVCEIG